MVLKVEPLSHFGGTFSVPSSKPETQRAILTSSLAAGRSRVFQDLRCDETETMKHACRALGAEIIEREDCLEINGVGNCLRYNNRVINAGGSAFVFRTLVALSSLAGFPVVITGDNTLRRRVMSPLFDALAELGGDLESICEKGHAPIVNWGRALQGGRCHLPGNVSSQLITAILFAAPLAKFPTDIEVTSEVYSQSYIRQTLSALAAARVSVDAAPDYRHFHVVPSFYQPAEIFIKEDYTSISYLLAAAALFKGRSVFRKVWGGSQQGEAAIIRILERLGLHVTHDDTEHTLTVENPNGMTAGDLEIDASDCPNIVPTLAAIGTYFPGTLRVVGAAVTRFHKSSRIEAIATELSRAGVCITVLYRDGVCDGFEVRGAMSYPGGIRFSNWDDHRIFMSLFVVSLRMNKPCFLYGFDGVRLSFQPSFQNLPRPGCGCQSSMMNSRL